MHFPSAVFVSPTTAEPWKSLEIMTASSKHEWFKSLIGVLVIALADVFQREIASFGSFTHRRADLLRALEPDACFYTVESDRSPTFPEVPLEQLTRFLAVGIERGELAMIQAVRAWFRKQPKKPTRRKRT